MRTRQAIRETINKIKATEVLTQPLLRSKLHAKYTTHLNSLRDDLSRKVIHHPDNNKAKPTNFSSISPYEREKESLAEIPDDKLEAIPAELFSNAEEDEEWRKVHINPDCNPILKKQLMEVCEEFKDLFHTTVQATPAKFEEFKLKVDRREWEQPKNRQPPRHMSREQEKEFEKMIQILLDNKVIEAVNEKSYHSHAFLVPKPNGKWRMVLDFKNLNQATKNHYQWPLPNIKEMLNRVGDKRPEFFAVFDLTSGYYQAPICKESQEFTSFMTPNGIYRWLRLPMGLTGGGSYFQHSLATKVLHGLIHNIYVNYTLMIA